MRLRLPTSISTARLSSVIVIPCFSRSLRRGVCMAAPNNAHDAYSSIDKIACHALRETQRTRHDRQMKVGAKIRALRKERGMTINDLATAADSDVGNISRLERDMQGASTQMLTKIADALNVSVADIFAEPGKFKVQENTATYGDDVPIPQFDVRGAMGNGCAPPDYADVIKRVTLTKDYLASIRPSFTTASNLAVVTGWGTSMVGTINHGDPVLVDRGVTQFVGDGVYLFTWDGLLYLKRLQKETRQSFTVISDSGKYQPFTIPIDEVIIHARAILVWAAKTL
ncbi:XRE family transcriptional regulator [Zobellella sp. DQSA1]|uniref:XRE family transcriptional regulator n=1 Tax=Zobellella sp. DQSA1 TaxID=3342386 RepID=UPI0035C12445